MKQIILVAVATFLIFYGCTNGDKPADPVSNTVSEEEKQLREAAAKHPDSLLLKEKLIQYLENTGNAEMAIAEINKVLQKDSLNARFWFKKGDLHMIDEDTAAAIDAYFTSVNIFPEPAVIMTLGSVYAAQKNDSALMMADALIYGSKSAANKEALFIKGLYWNYKGDKKKAIQFMDDCLAIDPRFMFAYREKTIALYDLGKFEEALQTIEKAVTLDIKFDEGYYWMGKCYEKMNKPEDAVESYKAALLITPDYTEVIEALKKLGAY